MAEATEELFAFPDTQARRLAGGIDETVAVLARGRAGRSLDKEAAEPGEYGSSLQLPGPAGAAGRQRVANRAGHVVEAHPSAGQASAVPRLRRAASRADVRDGRAGDLLPAPGWFVGRGPRPDQIIFEQTIRLDPLRSRIARAARRSPQEAGRIVKRRGGQCNRPPCVAQWPTNHSPSHPSPTRTPDRSWCPATQTTFSSSSSPRLAPDLPRSGRYRRSGSAGSRLRQ